MAAPITSSIEYLNVPITIGGFSTWSKKQTRSLSKQALPYDTVLPYYRSLQELSSYSYGGEYVGGADSLGHVPEPKYTDGWNLVKNRAYDKLRSRINSADMGVNLVEYRQASAMFGKRGADVLNVASLLVRRRFRDAGRILNASFYDGKPPRRNRNGWVLPNLTKRSNISLSNLWLEWHFGWSPLISDCQAAAKVISDPIPDTKIYGQAETFERYAYTTVTGTLNKTTETRSVVTRHRCRQGAYVAITNPNLALAGQLGLLNPAALAWEIVPFSFVVDWFVNVGDWLQGFTDFAGMTLRMPYTSQHTWSFDNFARSTSGYMVSPWWIAPTSGKRAGKVLYVSRKVGLQTPILSVRPLKLPSLSRAATVWSLASQILQRR